MGKNYKHNGRTLPSVTTIIGDCTDKSGPLTQWAANQVVEWIKANCGNDLNGNPIPDGYFCFPENLEAARMHFREVSQTALDVGSIVHSAVEHYLKTGKEPIITDDHAVAGFLAFLEWADCHEIKTIETEFTVAGDYWAGTLDWYGYLDGRLTVIDFKSSKAIYPEYRYQIAAYRSATDAVASAILRLDKETGYPEYRDYSNKHESDLAVFNAMVELYMLRHPVVAKKAGYKKEVVHG